MKLLRTIRFDVSDTFVYDVAAPAGEWAVSGAFAFAHPDGAAPAGKTRQAFANGFLGLGSFGRSTFVTVGEASAEDLVAAEQALAAHFVSAWGAPSLAAALGPARDELAFAADLCRDVPVNTVFTVRRRRDETGGIAEEFRIVEPRSVEDQHATARVWSVVDDGA